MKKTGGREVGGGGSSKSHRDASVVARVQRLLDDRVVVLVRDPNHVGNRG